MYMLQILHTLEQFNYKIPHSQFTWTLLSEREFQQIKLTQWGFEPCT